MSTKNDHAKPYNVVALWRGRQPLSIAFWLWGFVGGAGQLVALSALFLALADAPDGLVGWALIGWIGFLYVYFVLVFVGIWRSAGNEPKKSPAYGARGMVVLGGVSVVAITFQVLFMGGSPH